MERSEVPPQYRRRRRTNGLGCTCDCNYARSLQGICKVVALFILGLAWIIIGASPYWRPIFVIGGETWPFHIVMLLSVVVWLATLTMYCLFISGYHLSLGHYNWPRIELIFNIIATCVVLLAAILEAANVWRWDLSRGNQFTAGAAAGGSYSNYFQYGLRPGMSFTQTLNFGSYCGSRPQDCRDYFSLLAGNNTYYTNHIFGVVLLFFSVITYLVSTFFAYRTYRVFERDMYKPGELPKPTIWMRFTYQVDQATNYMKEKANKVLHRGEDEGEADIESDDGAMLGNSFIPPKKSNDGSEDVRSSRSEAVSSHARSHSSHHTSKSHGEHRSKSRSSHHKEHDGRSSRSSGEHRHKHDGGRSSRNSTGHRSRSSSKPRDPDKIKTNYPEYEVPPPYDEEPPALSQPQPAGAFPHLNSKKGSKKGKKDGNASVDMSPVASVMI